MKVFITFAAGESYEKLAEVLKESIETFSEYDLIVYKPEDFDIDYDPELWNGPSSINFSYKIMSCLKALESYDEVVWLDNDGVATHNIDKRWHHKVDKKHILTTAQTIISEKYLCKYYDVVVLIYRQLVTLC
jgi:hypothetical protein